MKDTDAVLHLVSLNTLRHNFSMLKIVRSATPDTLLIDVSKEMSLFCEGSMLLCDNKFAEFVDWFTKNTDPDVQAILLGAISEAMTETPEA
jgi:hypothetical protein